MENQNLKSQSRGNGTASSPLSPRWPPTACYSQQIMDIIRWSSTHKNQGKDSKHTTPSDGRESDDDKQQTMNIEEAQQNKTKISPQTIKP